MRLYVDSDQIKVLKNALQSAMTSEVNLNDFAKLHNLLERVELCEALQKNQEQAKINR